MLFCTRYNNFKYFVIFGNQTKYFYYCIFRKYLDFKSKIWTNYI